MAVIYTEHFAQFFDANGNPLSGGKLYAYSAGTTTPKATYTTAAATVENAHPIVLDSAGRATLFIEGSYRFDLYDANDVLIESTDNVTSFTTSTVSGAALLDAVQTFSQSQRVSSTVLTSASNSIAIDFALNNNFSHTLTENTTLANPTNIVAGQSGAIHITQNAGTARTLAYGSYWKFAAGVVPSVSTTLGAQDTLFYSVRSSTFIEANLVKGFA